MEVIISIVGSLASKVAEYTVDLAARQLGYLFKHKSMFLNLRSKVQELKDARQRLQESVEAATRNGEEIFDDVQRWLTEVTKKISEQAATQLQEDEEKATKRCFAGFCPNFKSRYHLTKKADREADAIAQLLIEKDAFNVVSYLPAVEAIDVIRPDKEYESFESRSGAFGGIMAALEDDAVSIIGVYGMGGVGKTTLVIEAFKLAKEKQLFNEAVLVAINQTPNMLDIQKEIAEKIGLTFTEESRDMRAARLRERLQNAKKVLVILDDIWTALDLEALGIPSGDEHKGCKILMTSRRLDVLESMNSQPNISIETLKDDEAWILFKKMAGHIVETSYLQSTAVEVAKRCAGLPIAIATIAKALKRKQNLYEWKNALEQLKPSKINFRGISGAVYSAIEMSYKYLETEELKFTFLLCSIMGHNAAIQDLVKHCRGFGLFRSLDTMEKVRNRVLALVSELKDSSLLLVGSTLERFDIHDVVRDVAVSIASRDYHWLALGKEDVFEEWSDKDTLGNCNLISFKHAKVSELPDELECPNLTFFSIHGTVKVPHNFFHGMQRLKFLEMHFTSLPPSMGCLNFTSLPPSIGCLKTLCTLRLIGCGLHDIAILGELENLEILDLRGSGMEVLPTEIGQLTRLKLLDLSECSHLKVITPNVLSELYRLEELFLYCQHSGFNGWEVEGIENPRRNASLVELQHLSCLTTLEVHIRHLEAIPKDTLFFRKMERYKISIGNGTWDMYHDRRMETSRMLKLESVKSTHSVGEIYRQLSRKAESLYLRNVEDVREMLYDPDAESFERLRFIYVHYCNTLKNLFSFSIAKRLRQLEELGVFICKNITTLIAEKEEVGENDIIEFSKLRILKFFHLDRFNGSWHPQNTFQSTAWLFDKKVSCPVLEELHLESVSGIEKIWHIDDQLPLPSFGGQCLTILRVRGCQKLKCVFTASMVKSLVQLKTLEVFDCGEMQELIEGILGGEVINSNIRVFPKLDSLMLVWLPKLNRFCSGLNSIEFPSLKSLTISDYSEHFNIVNEKNVVALPHYLFNEKVILPVLEQLEIRRMKNLERLWADLLVEHSFSRLTSIDLSHCHQLLNVFPLSMLTRLQRLNKLRIECCESVEEIVSESGPREAGISSAMPSLSPQLTQSDVFEFPALTSLELYSLSNLKSIHHNKMHTINWPSLKELIVRECHRVEILFASGETSSEQPLLWLNESTFPNLHQLTLGWNAGIRDTIRHCEGQPQKQFPSHYFPKLKIVKLKRWPDQVTVLLPSYLFQLLSLPDLQTLEISNSNFQGISEEGGEEKPVSLLLSQITELRLEDLPKLMYLWKEKEGFQNLRMLHVYRCHELKVNLVPSSVSFRNLVTLKVSDCVGIVKLITHSTAKSLVQLKEMSIQACRNMEEIIQGGEHDDEINFPKLETLDLVSLPKLESFYSSGNYTFLFPSSVSFRNLVTLKVEECDGIIKLITHSTAKSLVQLKEMSIWKCNNIEEIVHGGDDDDEISFPELSRLELVTLEKLKSFCSSGKYTFAFPSLKFLLLCNCLRMKTFSEGDSSTPMLHKLQTFGWKGEVRCEGSLNNTIRKLFRPENYEDDQTNSSTSMDSEEGEDFEEDQRYPSTSNTQNIIEGAHDFMKDQGSSSTSYLE